MRLIERLRRCMRFAPALLLLLAACGGSAPTAVTPIPLTATPTRGLLEPTAQTPARMPEASPTLPDPSTTPSPTFRPTRTPTAAATRTPTLAAGEVIVPAGKVSVPILLYHNISDRGNNRYIVRVKDFRAQVEALHRGGYQAITISRLAEVIRSGGSLPEKAVVITFDDGYLGVYENAFPILEEYGYMGVVYVITGTLGTEKSYGYLQQKELLELSAAGWEIGSHSVSHTNLKVTSLGIGNEMRQSKETLETLLGVKVRSFAYPYAVANAWIRERTAEYGYDSAVGIDIFMTHTPDSLYFLSRREVPRGISAAGFSDLLRPSAYEVAAAEQTLTVVTPTVGETASP